MQRSEHHFLLSPHTILNQPTSLDMQTFFGYIYPKRLNTFPILYYFRLDNGGPNINKIKIYLASYFTCIFFSCVSETQQTTEISTSTKQQIQN
jgi:hypothetical protein